MFSSEQIFEVSGDMGQLEKAIKFAISMFGGKCESYQISEDGKYCLGWMVKDGWKPFPFDFDAHIVSKIIEQHLNKQDYGESSYDYFDGSTEKGFLMKSINSEGENGIERPFYGIISIEPFWNFYAK